MLSIGICNTLPRDYVKMLCCVVELYYMPYKSVYNTTMKICKLSPHIDLIYKCV